MAIPERYRRLFEPELEPGELVVSAGNADLWLRYRRMALTDRRLLIVERGGVRNPFGGRRVTSVPLSDITSVQASANPIQQHLKFRLRDGSVRGYALPSFSQGSARFVQAVSRAVQSNLRSTDSAPASAT